MDNKQQNNENPEVKVDDDEMLEINNSKNILDTQRRRVECGAMIRIDAFGLLEEDFICMMRTPFLPRILTNVEDQCELTNSKDFQIEFASNPIDTGNSFLSLVTPYFKHVFEVVRFAGEEDDNNAAEFTKVFKKGNGSWLIVDTYLCEFCN